MRRNIELIAGSRRSTCAAPPAPFSGAGRAAISGESIVAGANESCAVAVAVVSIGPIFGKGHARQNRRISEGFQLFWRRLVKRCPVLAQPPHFLVLVLRGDQNQYSSRVRIRTSPKSTMPAVVICLMLSQIAAASPQIATTPYGEAIDLFREGRDELAVKKLGTLMSYELIQGRDALFNALASKRPEESERAAATIRAAVLLHTARAFAAIARSNQGEFRYQLHIRPGVR